MESNFDRDVNISYVDESLEKPSNSQVFKHYFSSIIVYSIIYLILNNNPFFIKQMNNQMTFYYTIFILSYILIAPIFLYSIKPKSIHNSHSIAIISYFIHLFKDIKSECFSSFNSLVQYVKPTYHQSQAFALFFVKVFFGTLMFAGMLNNINVITSRLPAYAAFFHSITNLHNMSIFEFISIRSNFIFFNLILLLFTIDLTVFAFGYVTELDCLKNKIRSIDTSLGGLFLCLCCYPPFNSVTSYFLGWNQSESNSFFGDERSLWTILFRLMALFFLAIYVAATIALGTRASNLTNRGTVSRFPYNVIRHPAYISKNLFWILTTIPMFFTNNYMSLWQIFLIVLSLITWAGIYYLRALTEERHLLKDPEYQEYTRKVKYRFIPYIY